MTDRPLTDAEAIQERWTSPGSTILETYPPEFILPALRNGGMLPDDAAVVSRAGEDIAALLAENARLRELNASGKLARARREALDEGAELTTRYVKRLHDSEDENTQLRAEVERLREADRD